jgi:hypothetical protein
MVETASVRPCRRPAWFDPAIKTVLDTVSGPRELEQVTVELLGVEMDAEVQAGQGGCGSRGGSRS